MSDPLSDVLTLLNVTSAITSRFEATGVWAMYFAAYPHVKFVTVAKGDCWIQVDDGSDSLHIVEGDCYLLTRGDAYRIGSSRDMLPSAIDGGEYFRHHRSQDGVVRYGARADLLAIGGHFTLADENSALLLDLLPSVIHIRSASPAAAALRGVLALLVQEVQNAKPGLGLMTESLARMAFVQVLRTFAENPHEHSPGWLGALGDAKIGAALSLMHAEPSRRWTLAELCAAAGMSRSRFALRFKTLVGVAPLDYLLQWRMRLARRALRNGAQPVSKLAFEFGYASESAFSSAFKRVTGSAGERQLSWPVDDNYLGRFVT